MYLIANLNNEITHHFDNNILNIAYYSLLLFKYLYLDIKIFI